MTALEQKAAAVYSKSDALRWLDLLKSAYGLDASTDLPKAGRALYISSPYFGSYRVERVTGGNYKIETVGENA